MNRCAIYCRISSLNQMKVGMGLESQELTCRQYCENNEYEVVSVLKDNISGATDFIKRPAMKELMNMMESGAVDVVVFDSLNRLSRDTLFYLQFKQVASKLGIRLESATQKFDETPQSHFVETIIASVGQMERQMNAERVKRRMNARLMAGGYNSNPPRGFKAVRLPSLGRVLVPKEPEYGILRTVFRKYIEDDNYDCRDAYYEMVGAGLEFGDNKPKLDRARRILKNFVFTGYNRVEGKLYKAYHDGFVTVDEHCYILEKLKNRNKRLVYGGQSRFLEYPWKGMIACAECGVEMTTCPSTGKLGKKYHYYYCLRQNSRCEMKGIRAPFKRDVVNDVVTKYVVECAAQIDFDIELVVSEVESVNKAIARQSEGLEGDSADVIELKKQKDTILNRLLQVSEESLIKTYEDKLIEIDKQIENASTGGVVGGNTRTLRTSLEIIKKYLEKVDVITNKGLYSYNYITHKMLFGGMLQINSDGLLRTPKKSDIYRVLSGFNTQNSHMVEMAGLEPASR